MPVIHPYVSAIADGGDATLVQPSNWNANHTLADGSTAASGLGYTVPLGFWAAAVSPADSTTYYAGVIPGNMGAVNDTFAESNFEIPVAGTITAVSYSWRSSGTLATTESVTTAISINGTSDIASTAEARFDVVAETLVVTGLSQAVAVGDKIALKIATPVWTTNPQFANATAVVYII